MLSRRSITPCFRIGASKAETSHRALDPLDSHEHIGTEQLKFQTGEENDHLLELALQDNSWLTSGDGDALDGFMVSSDSGAS